jgi:hypothetical protein
MNVHAFSGCAHLIFRKSLAANRTRNRRRTAIHTPNCMCTKPLFRHTISCTICCSQRFNLRSFFCGNIFFCHVKIDLEQKRPCQFACKSCRRTISTDNRFTQFNLQSFQQFACKSYKGKPNRTRAGGPFSSYPFRNKKYFYV